MCTSLRRMTVKVTVPECVQSSVAGEPVRRAIGANRLVDETPQIVRVVAQTGELRDQRAFVPWDLVELGQVVGPVAGLHLIDEVRIDMNSSGCWRAAYA